MALENEKATENGNDETLRNFPVKQDENTIKLEIPEVKNEK